MKLLSKGLILLLSIAAGFGADKDRPVFRPGPAELLPNSQKIADLTIGADAFSTREETLAAFGKLDPAKYGILPVLVVMQNDSAKALRLTGMSVEYIRPDRRRLDPVPPEDVRFLSGVKKPNTSGPAIRYPIPGIGGKKKNPLDAAEVQGRSFAVEMLPPHDSASGFFYFNTVSYDEAVLYITGIVEASTGQELFYFEIPLE